MSSPKHQLRLAGALAVLATLALTVSCRGFFVNPTVSSITVAPATPLIVSGTTGNTVQMSVTAVFDDGSTGHTPVNWTIAPANGGVSAATISQSGLVTAAPDFTTVGLMSVTATATQNSTITGSTTLTVTAPCITKITVTPTSPSVIVGSVVPFFATATTCNGDVDLSSVASWVSSNTAVATMDTNGNATTLTVGTTNITASSNGKVSTAVILTVTN